MHPYEQLVVCQIPLQNPRGLTGRRAKRIILRRSILGAKRGRDNPLINDQSQSPVDFHIPGWGQKERMQGG